VFIGSEYNGCKEKLSLQNLGLSKELMIFWEACKADNRSYGMQLRENRRIGAHLWLSLNY
jgi:hypothetical protein